MASGHGVVLVAGAGHGPENFSHLAAALKARGFAVALPVIPSSNGERPPTKTFLDDVLAVREATEIMIDQGRSVIVVSHLYGGVPASDALKGLSADERKVSGLTGGVVHLVFLCAYALPQNWSIMTLVERAGVESRLNKIMHVYEDGTWHPKDPEGQIYHDLSSDEATRQASVLISWNPIGISAKVSYAPWIDIPATFVYTTQDKWVSMTVQNMITDQIKAAGVRIREICLNSGHAVFAKEPQRLADEMIIIIQSQAAPQ